MYVLHRKNACTHCTSRTILSHWLNFRWKKVHNRIISAGFGFMLWDNSYIKLEIWWSYFEWCVKINCCKALSFTKCALIIHYFSARASLLISFEQSPLLLTIELRNATSMIKCYIYIFSTITYYFSVVQHRSMWITMVALACSTLQWGLTTS